MLGVRPQGWPFLIHARPTPMTDMKRVHRLIRCRCVLADGSRCELLVIATGCCAALCELLGSNFEFRRISATLA